ncbi:hypothetical protein FPQ18DRAFT_396773 [Pyronema domesticum]|nr:hypothetical protein FPQ18DRAFT_396773 [Pyronema domesticum]
MASPNNQVQADGPEDFVMLEAILPYDAAQTDEPNASVSLEAIPPKDTVSTRYTTFYLSVWNSNLLSVDAYTLSLKLAVWKISDHPRRRFLKDSCHSVVIKRSSTGIFDRLSKIKGKGVNAMAERDILFPDYFRTETEDLWGNYLKAIEVEVEARTAMLSKCQTLGAASKLAIQEHQKAKKSREEYYQRIRYVVQRTRFELATNPHRYHKSFWSLVVAKVGELDAASECLRKDTVTVQSVAENMAGSTPYVGVSSPSDPWAPVAVRKGEFIEEAEMKKKMKEEEIERQRIEFEGSKRQRLGEWVMSVDPEQDNHEQEEN